MRYKWHDRPVKRRYISKKFNGPEKNMIRYKLKELLADKQFRDGRRVTLGEVAEATGIHRTTLSKLANVRGYNTTTDVLDRLCAYFDCHISDLVEYVPDGEVRTAVRGAGDEKD